MISIVIPLYNKEKQIGLALQSVFQQTYQDFEIIIVDDGSTDQSAEVVKKSNDKRIKLFQQKNAGVSAARNQGVEIAQGEWIAFLDADDEWMPEYLETQVTLSEKFPEASVCATGYVLQDEFGKRHTPKVHCSYIDENGGLITNYFEIVASSAPLITSISVFIKKKALLDVGGFLLNATLGEDLITWAKLACKCTIAYTPKALAIYHFPNTQLLIPGKKPDKTDLVGAQFNELYKKNTQISGLKEYIVLWHKMRMTSFVRLNMKAEAHEEYIRITSYVVPGFKIKVWHTLNMLPHFITMFILKYALKR